MVNSLPNNTRPGPHRTKPACGPIKLIRKSEQNIKQPKLQPKYTYLSQFSFCLRSIELIYDVMIMFNLFITFFSCVFIKSTESNSFAQFKIADLADPASFLEAESMTTGSHITCAALCR